MNSNWHCWKNGVIDRRVLQECCFSCLTSSTIHLICLNASNLGFPAEYSSSSERYLTVQRPRWIFSSATSSSIWIRWFISNRSTEGADSNPTWVYHKQLRQYKPLELSPFCPRPEASAAPWITMKERWSERGCGLHVSEGSSDMHYTSRSSRPSLTATGEQPCHSRPLRRTTSLMRGEGHPVHLYRPPLGPCEY